MKKYFKSLISYSLVIVLSFSLLFSFSKNVFASDSQNSSSAISVFQSPEMQNELEELNALARQYYDYYIENGSFPDDNISSYTYIPSFQAISILSDAGFSTSANSLAQLAASMGILAGLDGPLPIGDVCAIILGVTFIIGSGISYYNINNLYSKIYDTEKLVANAVFSNSYVASNNAKQAITNSKVYVDNVNNGKKYFACTLNKGAGGGIIISYPISELSAVSRLQRTTDVFSVNQNSAYNIASQAGNGFPDLDGAHNTIKQPLNLPHYHAKINGNRIDAHSFFI